MSEQLGNGDKVGTLEGHFTDSQGKAKDFQALIPIAIPRHNIFQQINLSLTQTALFGNLECS